MCLTTLTKDFQICLKKIKKEKWNRHEDGRVGKKRSYIWGNSWGRFLWVENTWAEICITRGIHSGVNNDWMSLGHEGTWHSVEQKEWRNWGTDGLTNSSHTTKAIYVTRVCLIAKLLLLNTKQYGFPRNGLAAIYLISIKQTREFLRIKSCMVLIMKTFNDLNCCTFGNITTVATIHPFIFILRKIL